MKKFLAIACAGIMVLSAAACSKKVDGPVAEEKVEEKKEVLEEKIEEVEEEVEESSASFDYVQNGIGLNLPDGWVAQQGHDSAIIKIDDGNDSIEGMVISSAEGEPDGELYLFGLGKGSAKNGTEPETIEPFDAGKFTWSGYSMIYPAIWYDQHVVNLISEPNEDGKYMCVQVWLGEEGKEKFALGDDHVGYVMESLDFTDETEGRKQHLADKEEKEDSGIILGLSFDIPEDWKAGEGSGYVWIAPPSMGNKVYLQEFFKEPGDDFNIMGTGKFTSQVEGTEPVEIEPFECGNYTWHGYSIDFPGYFGPETIVLLASNMDSKIGKAVGARIDLGLDDKPDFSLDSEEIRSILSSIEIKY